MGSGHTVQKPFVRIPVMIMFFLVSVVAAIFAARPRGMITIFNGVFGISCVFRHCSRHEDEIIDEVAKENRFIKIDGHLRWEVLLAIRLLFVFATIAFS